MSRERANACTWIAAAVALLAAVAPALRAGEPAGDAIGRLRLRSVGAAEAALEDAYARLGFGGVCADWGLAAAFPAPAAPAAVLPADGEEVGLEGSLSRGGELRLAPMPPSPEGLADGLLADGFFRPRLARAAGNGAWARRGEAALLRYAAFRAWRELTGRPVPGPPPAFLAALWQDLDRVEEVRFRLAQTPIGFRLAGENELAPGTELPSAGAVAPRPRDPRTAPLRWLGPLPETWAMALDVAAGTNELRLESPDAALHAFVAAAAAGEPPAWELRVAPRPLVEAAIAGFPWLRMPSGSCADALVLRARPAGAARLEFELDVDLAALAAAVPEVHAP